MSLEWGGVVQALNLSTQAKSGTSLEFEASQDCTGKHYLGGGWQNGLTGFTVRPDNLTLIPGAYIVERERALKMSLDLQT